MRPGYKQTEVGVIPQEWVAVRAGEIGRFRGGNGFPTRFQGETSNDYPFYKVSDMNNEGNETFMSDSNNWISERARQQLGATAFPADSIIFAKVGAAVFLERKKILTRPSCIDNNLAGLVLDKARADVRFVHYSFLNIKFGAFVATTALPSLNSGVLSRITFGLPPLPEQRAIVTALNDVDALLGALDQFIGKKRDLKQAAMQQLLTGRRRLPGFRGEWKVRRLDELGTWKGGMTPSMRNPSYWVNGAVPWISSGDVKSVLLTETGYSVTASAVAQGKTTLLPPNCIVIVTRSGILRKYLPVAMNVLPMAINQDIKALIPGEGFQPTYLLHALIGNGDRILARCMKAGTTVESIEYGWLKAFTIQIPPRPEQAAIAEVLSDMDAELVSLEQRRKKTRDLKQGMMQELLTGRTRLV